MKMVVIQAALLVAALGFAYQTWTREESTPDAPGSIRIWNGDGDEVSALTYTSDELRTVIERREDEEGSYLWASVTHVEKADTTVADSATAAADSTRAAPAAPTRQASFKVGEQAERLTELAASPLALRDLGIPDEAQLREYGLDDPEEELTIVVDGRERTLQLGGQPWGSSDRYVRDKATGRAYVLDPPLLRMMSNAEMSLPERRLHAFEEDRVATVTIRSAGGVRTMRRNAQPDGTVTWVLPERPDSPDQTFANFMERVGRLWLQEFLPDKEMGDLQHVVRLDYVDQRGNEIGYLDLYNEPAEGGGRAYFIRTELSRVPVAVHASIAEQIEEDVNTLF